MAQQILVYATQTYRCRVDFSQVTTEDDEIVSIDVSVPSNQEAVMQDGGVVAREIGVPVLFASGEVVNGKEAVVSFTGLGPGGPVLVEAYVESEANRANLICYEVQVVAIPPIEPLVLQMTAGDRILYRLDYSTRLVEGEALCECTGAQEDQIDLSVGTQVYQSVYVLMGVGTSRFLAAGTYDIKLMANTTNGRTFEDTIRVIVGRCDG